MNRMPMSIVFLVMLAAGALFTIQTSQYLPLSVGVTFGGDGLAHNFMTRDDYFNYALIITVGLPLLVVAVLGWLPKAVPETIKIPNRDRWLEPEKRNDTIMFVSRQAHILGCILVCFMIGLQWIVMKANEQNPPRLDNAAFVGLLIALLISIGIWIAVTRSRFRRPHSGI